MPSARGGPEIVAVESTCESTNDAEQSSDCEGGHFFVTRGVTHPAEAFVSFSIFILLMFPWFTGKGSRGSSPTLCVCCGVCVWTCVDGGMNEFWGYAVHGGKYKIR